MASLAEPTSRRCWPAPRESPALRHLGLLTQSGCPESDHPCHRHLPGRSQHAWADETGGQYVAPSPLLIKRLVLPQQHPQPCSSRGLSCRSSTLLAVHGQLTSSMEMPSRARMTEVGASGGLLSLQASSRQLARWDQASARLVLLEAWDMLAPQTSWASLACSSKGTCQRQLGCRVWVGGWAAFDWHLCCWTQHMARETCWWGAQPQRAHAEQCMMRTCCVEASYEHTRMCISAGA